MKRKAATPEEQRREHERKQRMIQKAAEHKDVTSLTWRQKFDCINDWDPWKQFLLDEFQDRDAFRKWLREQIVKQPFFVEAILFSVDDDHRTWPRKVLDVEKDELYTRARASLDKHADEIWNVYKQIWQMYCVNRLKIKEIKNRLKAKMESRVDMLTMLMDSTDSTKVEASRALAETRRQEAMWAVGVWHEAKFPVEPDEDVELCMIQEITTRFLRLEDGRKFYSTDKTFNDSWKFAQKCDDNLVLFDSDVTWLYNDTGALRIRPGKSPLTRDVWEKKLQASSKSPKIWEEITMIQGLRDCGHDMVATRHTRENGVLFRCKADKDDRNQIVLYRNQVYALAVLLPIVGGALCRCVLDFVDPLDCIDPLDFVDPLDL